MTVSGLIKEVDLPRTWLLSTIALYQCRILFLVEGLVRKNLTYTSIEQESSLL